MIETFHNIGCPLYSAILTDFHNADPSPVLDSIYKLKPEMILIAGDLFYGERPENCNMKTDENQRSLELLRGCSAAAPTYMSLGNHEWTLTAYDIEKISATGTILLDNCWIKQRDVVIGGLSSAYYSGYQAIRAERPDEGLYPVPITSLRGKYIIPDLKWLDEFEKQPGYKILLCHHPEYFPKYLKNRMIDLVISGHAHGGQWRYKSPVDKKWKGIYAPGQGLFPALTSGIHDDHLLISRGLSNPTIIPRINNPTEIIYIR